MKFDLGKLLGVVSVVASLVSSTQERMKGKSGAEKKDAVVSQISALLPILEGITDSDIADNAGWDAAIASLIAAEKAALVARANVAALIADIKAKRKGNPS